MKPTKEQCIENAARVLVAVHAEIIRAQAMKSDVSGLPAREVDG